MESFKALIFFCVICKAEQLFSVRILCWNDKILQAFEVEFIQKYQIKLLLK